MSPQELLYMCACATLVVAGPINRIDESIPTKSASEMSEPFPRTDVDHAGPMKLTVPPDEKLESIPNALVDLKSIEKEVPSAYKVKKRIRRSVLGNGKCSAGHVKVGNACMSCEQLGTC